MLGTLEVRDLPGPRPLIGLGNSHQIRPATFHLCVEGWARRHGPVYRFTVGREPIVAISDPTEINQLLRARPELFRRWSVIEQIFDEIGVRGVFSAEGDNWRRQRRLAVRALNSNFLNRYYQVIRVSTDRLLRVLTAAARASASVDIRSVLNAFTVDVMCSLAFGQDVNTLEQPDQNLPRHLKQVLTVQTRRVTAPFPYWRYVRLPSDRAMERSMAALHAAVGKFVKEARAELAERPELVAHPENFLQSMLGAQLEEGSFTDEEITGNTLTILGAGQDSTANTVAWAMWYVGRDQDVQRRLADDALARLGSSRLPHDYEAAAGLAYAEAVLREVLRLRSAVPFIALEARRETEVMGVRVPANGRLLLLTRMATVQDQSFSSGSSFDPSRWMTKDHERVHDSSAFLTFGAGPRFCPGRNVALLEGKSVLGTIARNFEVSIADPSARVRERFRFAMEPVGLRIKLRERT